MERDIFLPDVQEEPNEDHTLKICNRIYENKAFCRVLFGPHGDTSYLNRKMTAAHEKTASELRKKCPDADIVILEYVFTFFQKDATGMLEQWIQGGFVQPPKKIANLINEFGTAAIQYLNSKGIFTM